MFEEVAEYFEGWRAYDQRAGLCDNPYQHVCSAQAEAWKDGWYDARYEEDALQEEGVMHEEDA